MSKARFNPPLLLAWFVKGEKTMPFFLKSFLFLFYLSRIEETQAPFNPSLSRTDSRPRWLPDAACVPPFFGLP